MDEAGYREVSQADLGTFQIFQETYDPQSYKEVHLKGPKTNYLWRLFSLHRAMKAGIDDVGIGALLGLSDWKFEALSLLETSFLIQNHRKYSVFGSALEQPQATQSSLPY